MSYPLVVIGAGASAGCLNRSDYPNNDSDLDRWIPPLTTQLFDGTKFHELLSNYKEMDGLVAHIRGKLRSAPNASFEEVLTNQYREGTKSYTELYKSFAALLFYLAELFETITQKYYRGYNNYSSLIHKISQNGNRALFVNFNYDLLLEKNIGKYGIESLDELLKDNYPVIKIHGAYNWHWVRLINSREEERNNNYENAIKGAQSIFSPEPPNAVFKRELVLKDKNPRNLSITRRDALTAFAFHPAIALPLIEKDNFVCPVSHIEFLKDQLSKIDRIIMIGWRGADEFFRNLLIEELQKRKIPIYFVGMKNSKSIVDSFEDVLKENINSLNSSGFSNFVDSENCEKFLRG